MPSLSLSERLLIGFFKVVNAVIPWHRLPRYIGAFNLLALRDELRDKNLHDTYPSEEYQGKLADPPMDDSKFLAIRNSDGMFNDTERPKMGCRHMR
jgi:hypothetical protein